MKVWACLLVLLPLALTAPFDLRPYDKTAAVAFHNMDTNNDGEYDLEEMKRSYDVYDANKNGIVSREEFTNYEAHLRPEMYMVAHGLYDQYDFNGDGVLMEEDFQFLYKLIDANENQVISELEYVHWMKNVLEGLDHLHHP